MKKAAGQIREMEAPVVRSKLLTWYDAHQRDLPWRGTCDPYRVWVSEIMLQQTRVAAVIEHYHAFLRRFPTVEKLAAARESSVLAAWSGLGYYRRARNLHAAAKVVVSELGGEFPTAAAKWRELPGIGRYTAAAIASIAFDEPVALVDGNVERVLRRVLGRTLSGETVWQIAESLLDRKRPGDFNQAMMELGATVCTPRSPSCLMCPVIDLCATRGELAASPKAGRQQKREIHVALDCRPIDHNGGSVFLAQRPRNARLMPGMWELPEMPRRKLNGQPAFTLRHSITVTDYTVQVWREHVWREHVWQNRVTGQPAGKWISLRRLRQLAMTGLTRKILRQAGLLSSQASEPDVESSKIKDRPARSDM